MIKSMQKGFGLVEAVIAIAVLAAVVAGLVFVLGSNSEDSESTSNTSSADADTSSEIEAADEQPQVATSGDYSFENVGELGPVCETNSFPTGALSSTEGNLTVAFVQEEAGEEFEYKSTAITSDSGLRTGFATNEVDMVACLSNSGDQAFEVDCTTDGTDFTLVGFTYNVDLYDLQQQTKVGSTTVESSRDCPSFATLRDGKAEAIKVDPEQLAAYVKSL